MRRLAMLSMHTSPLAQPGVGDGGGMNVYVRELAASLAQAGVVVDVYTRATDPDAPERVSVEPGLEVIHVSAGPRGPMDKELLPSVVEQFVDGVGGWCLERGADVLHANYWLSGVAGHRLKHRLDRPLVSTFHTLARVKALADAHEPAGRAVAEAEVIGCSDVICASCPAEADQIVELYDADSARIELVAPGVDHAFFSPGDRRGARTALGLGDEPVVLFVGRIQPLKGVDVAVDALDHLRRAGHGRCRLLVVGGPSGPEGPAALDALRRQIDLAGLAEAVDLVDPQPHHLLSTYYRAADVCVVPSRSESFGLVALEAAACGTPVVAASVGGLPTIVRHGRTGFLVEGRDPAAYAEAVSRLLDDDAAATRISRQAARHARGFSWAIAAGRLRRLYTDLATSVPVACS